MPAETRSLRTLVADDDSDIRSLMEITAIMAGLDVVAVVGDGRSALDVIERGGIELAILDVSMPEMSGLEVLASIRASRPRTDPRVVIVSASVDAASLAAGLESGADDYVTKPFSPRRLAERLRELIGEWER
ncbi:response regulator [Leifsonia sp. YIM 134122]|uniref:Response regulator n=1 Tax=Leifsonia stereocauli TaxID=3134136 RepID=A0ABU9W087_9MICO